MPTSARPPKGWRRRALRLGSFRVVFQVDRFGRCTSDECGYSRLHCPNGCEQVYAEDEFDEELALFLEELQEEGS